MAKFLKQTTGAPRASTVLGTDLGSASATAIQFLAADGAGNSAFRSIVGGDIPTLNQNTTGSAASLSATLSVITGGTGQTTYTDGQLLIGNTSGNTLTKATLTAGTNITITNGNGSITIASTGGGGGSGTALSKAIVQTAHGFSVGNVIYYTGTAYAKAQANADSTSEVVGIVSAVADANNFTVTMDGYVSGLSGLTAGSTYYLDYSTAGGLTSTEPLQTGYISKPVLIADSTTSGYVIQSRGIANSQGISLPMSDWASYTPTYSASLGTVTASNMFWRRVGDSLELKGQFTIGSTTGVVATMSLPNSVVIDSSKDPIKRVQGIYYRTVSGGVGNKGGPTIVDPGLSVLKFSDDQFIGSATVNALTDGFGSNMGNSGDTINVDVTGIPISGWSSGGGTSPLLSLSDWTAYTPTFTNFGTTTSNSLWYRRVGDSVEISGRFVTGTVVAAEARMGLPSGLTSDAVKVPAIKHTGEFFRDATTTDHGGALLIESNVSYVTFGSLSFGSSSANALTKANGAAIANNSEGISVYAMVPVSGWTSVSSGSLTAPRSQIRLNTGNGHGSTNTTIRRFSTTVQSAGSAITYADSATLGATFTINETGIYSMSWNDQASGFPIMGFSLNSSQLTTSISSITAADTLAWGYTAPSGNTGSISWTGLLTANDVIRAHSDGTLNSTNAHNTIFTIAKVGN